jgi:hypothetical protein
MAVLAVAPRTTTKAPDKERRQPEGEVVQMVEGEVVGMVGLVAVALDEALHVEVGKRHGLLTRLSSLMSLEVLTTLMCTQLYILASRNSYTLPPLRLLQQTLPLKEKLQLIFPVFQQQLCTQVRATKTMLPLFLPTLLQRNLLPLSHRHPSLQPSSQFSPLRTAKRKKKKKTMIPWASDLNDAHTAFLSTSTHYYFFEEETQFLLLYALKTKEIHRFF